MQELVFATDEFLGYSLVSFISFFASFDGTWKWPFSANVYSQKFWGCSLVLGRHIASCISRTKAVFEMICESILSPRYHWDKTNVQLNNSFIQIYIFFYPENHIDETNNYKCLQVSLIDRVHLSHIYILDNFHKIYMWPLSFSKWYKIRLVMTIHNIAFSRLAFRLCGREQHLKGAFTFPPPSFLPVSLAFNLLLRSLFWVKTQKQT